MKKNRNNNDDNNEENIYQKEVNNESSIDNFEENRPNELLNKNIISEQDLNIHNFNFIDKELDGEISVINLFNSNIDDLKSHEKVGK